MRYGCRGQGGAARPERGAIVPYRSAMRFGWRIGAALAMLFNAIPATDATPAADAFVEWARTHAIDLPVCSSILSGADYSDRKSVVSGKSVYVRVDLGGSLTVKKTK